MDLQYSFNSLYNPVIWFILVHLERLFELLIIPVNQFLKTGHFVH